MRHTNRKYANTHFIYEIPNGNATATAKECRQPYSHRRNQGSSYFHIN